MKTKKEYRKQGKRNKRMGADFEKRTRKDLEEKGWIVSKWQNTIKEGKCVGASPGRFRMMQTGFPDFICYGLVDGIKEKHYIIHFIECKTNGYLSKEEKQKAQWYLDNNFCSKFLIAYKEKEGRRVVVKYKDFEEYVK